MSKQSELLHFRQQQLKRQITEALDLLQGSLHKNPSQRGYHLTLKVEQKTVTKYVRKELVPLVRAMTAITSKSANSSSASRRLTGACSNCRPQTDHARI